MNNSTAMHFDIDKQLMFDYSKLRGRIREKKLQEGNVAKLINMAPSTFSLKLNNLSKFTQDEIINLVLILDIPIEQIGAYFFTLTV